jgi:hypothetical protein
MDLADFNVSKTLLFLIEVQKLAELWPNTRIVSGELGQICPAIWIPVNSPAGMYHWCIGSIEVSLTNLGLTGPIPVFCAT